MWNCTCSDISTAHNKTRQHAQINPKNKPKNNPKKILIKNTYPECPEKELLYE